MENFVQGLEHAMSDVALLVARLQRNGMEMQEKGTLDVVTKADIESEKILSDWVAASVPADGIEAEEGTSRPSQSGWTWYFDPIDGTKNFASGLPFYGISAGRAKDGAPHFGWLCFPPASFNIFGGRGSGVWRCNFRGTTNTFERKPYTRSFKESVIALGLTLGNDHLFPAFKNSCWNAVMIGSFVYETLLVMEGHYAGYVHTNATQFDCAGAIPIAQELGLVACGKDGHPVDLRRKKIPVAIAQNQEIMDQILEIWNKYS